MEDWRVMALQKHRGVADSSVWVGRCSALWHLVVVCLCMLPVVSTREEQEPENVRMFMSVIQDKVSVWCGCVTVWLCTSCSCNWLVLIEYTKWNVEGNTMNFMCCSLHGKGFNSLFIHWSVSLSDDYILQNHSCFQWTVGPDASC